MRRKMLVLVSVTALAIGVSLFAVPSIGRAVTITSINVTDGQPGGTFTGGIAGLTWVFNPIILSPGQSLVLTQNQLNQSSGPSGLPGFNFDTSENTGPGGAIKATKYTVLVNGVDSFLDSSGALNVNGNDFPSSHTNNEAANWVKIGGVAGSYDLYVGYADTLHSDACLDGGDCLPSYSGNTIWKGTANFFYGNATNIPGYSKAGDAPAHCNVEELSSGSWNCYDAGAILIVATTVPEPSSVLLVGTLIIGLTGWGLRRNRKTV
jgi:hypothetical protein